MESRGLIASGLIALLLSCGLGVWAQDHNVPFRPRAAAGGGVVLNDDFNRADATNISTGAPFTWTEIAPVGDESTCDIDILTNELRFESNHASSCDYSTFQIRADSDLNGVDQYVLYSFGGTNDWGGHGAIVRTQSGAGLGAHYEFLCNDNTCASIRVGRYDGTAYQEGVTLDTECDATGEGWSTIADGDYVGVSVEGTGAGTTTFKMWDHGASDPGDYGSWGTATCTVTPSGYTAVDTGARVGLRSYSSQASTSSQQFVDNFEGGDIP